MTYLTLADTARDNARRHLRRAQTHARAGDLDYAAGSLAKAARNHRRAKSFQLTHRYATLVDRIIDRFCATQDAAFLFDI